jgi:hypothetical protein
VKETPRLVALLADFDANQAAIASLEADRNAIDSRLRDLRRDADDLKRKIASEKDHADELFLAAVMMKRDQGLRLEDIARAERCSVPTISKAVARWQRRHGVATGRRKRR